MQYKCALERFLSESEAQESTIGRFLRSKRFELGLTQKEVAARAGISQQALSNIEIGLRLPRSDTIERLEKVIGEIPAHLISYPQPRNKGVPFFSKKRTNALGKFVTKRRLELHLTQEQVAERLGVCRVVVARIETGTYKYVKNLLERLATALKCELNNGGRS